MPREPYEGTSRKLVLAFDIGTTYSGAAYAFLDPGEVPEIDSVKKYLDNPNVGTEKVPSILYYDQDGNFRGVENGTGLDEDESLVQLRWWKLLLGPTEPAAALRKQMSAELPHGKTIVDVFSDMMRYLFDSTKTLYISTDPNAESRWNSAASNGIELVLTHPNGWEGPQQSQMRTAAIRAGIVPDTPEGRNRVNFVTEGEASFNFCVTHTESGKKLKHGDKVLIVDAGGGTIDISSYVVTKGAPLQVEELFRPKCLHQGGEFVTARARDMVAESKLKRSKFNTPEDIAAFAQKFDGGLKRVFSDDRSTQYVKFGGMRDNDPRQGINAGKLRLTGEEVAGFFEPSIRTTVDAIRGDFKEILSMSSYAYLVGGFASSPWLKDQLNRRLSSLGLKFFKPDTNTNKAVAVGAVSYYIDHFVKGRITRFTYGTPCSTPYKPNEPEHIKREHKVYTNVIGEKYISEAFRCMLSKDTKVLESREIRAKMQVVREGCAATDVLARIVRYDGDNREPKWMDVEKDKFKTLCHIAADVSETPCTLKPGKSGGLCYRREYEVVLMVGLTELKAQICWFDPQTGTEKSGEAAVVYKDGSESSNAVPRVADSGPPPRYSEFGRGW